MRGYRCESCGKTFNPEKEDLCPRCGATVRPSVLTGIQRKKNAAWLRSEGKFADPGCHEDDAWSASYGAQTHRAAVHAHEAELRAANVAHNQATGPAGQQSTAQTRKKGGVSPLVIFIIFIVLSNFLVDGGLGELFTGLLDLIREILEGLF